MHPRHVLFVILIGLLAYSAYKSSMAAKSTRDQIVALKNAGLSNKQITKQLKVGRKICIQCNETVQGDWQDLQQAYSRQKALCSNKEEH